MGPDDIVAEAGEAASAYQAALVNIGVATIAEAISLWQRLTPAARKARMDDWLEEATRSIFGRRGQSRELAISYYRLVRALRTGTTVPDPRALNYESVTLGQLRSEFAELVNIAGSDSSVEALGEGRGATFDPDRPVGSSELITVEPEFSADPMLELDALERELLAAEEAELALIEADLSAIADDEHQARLDQLSDEISAKAYALAEDEADRKSAARAASFAEKSALDAARQEVSNRAGRDRRAVGWARVSTSGTPCGFCAMLISRGAVYKTRNSASVSARRSEFHPNCHCEAVPMFSVQEYNTEPMFALNRAMTKNWHEHGGTLNTFRRWIDEQNKRARSLPKT